MENTLVIFTSDHGDSMGAHGLIQKQNCFYDSFTHIPYMISWQNKITPGRTDHLFELVDLMPTVLDLLQIPVPYGVQGKSHAGFLKGCDYVPKEYVVMESGEKGDFMRVSDIGIRPETPFDESCFVWCAYREAYMGKGKSICTGDWKLNVYSNGDGELYNLVNDPDELCNLYGNPNYEPKVFELFKKLFNWSMENEELIPENKTVHFHYK